MTDSLISDCMRPIEEICCILSSRVGEHSFGQRKDVHRPCRGAEDVDVRVGEGVIYNSLHHIVDVRSCGGVLGNLQ